MTGERSKRRKPGAARECRRGGPETALSRWSPVAAATIAVLAAAGCRKSDFPQYPSNYREYAYVTNGASGTVTVLDVVNVRVDREIQVGQNPVAVAANPAKTEVYVVNSGAAGGVGSVSVINARNNSVAATIAVHRRPVSIHLNAAGTRAYVANSESNTVSVIDLNQRRETAVIGAGEGPATALLSPDGTALVVANRGGNSVSIFNPETLRVRSVFEGCPGASDVVILPDSTKAFVACSGGHQVMALGLARPAAPASANPATQDRLEAMMDVGRAPVQLALKPDGGEFFVCNSASDSVSEVSTPTNDVGGATLMGSDPMHGVVSRDNSLLYVANFRSQEVAVYAIDDGRREGAIHVGDGPSAMAFSAAGHLLFVVDTRSGDVAAVRTSRVLGADSRSPSLVSSGALFTLLPAGRGPNAIAVKAFVAN